jgi:hypothetical protein
MRFLIKESFDAKDVNRAFEADVVYSVGGHFRTKSGKKFRVLDVAFYADPFDRAQNVWALVKRVA